jgi:hypothetical protein
MQYTMQDAINLNASIGTSLRYYPSLAQKTIQGTSGSLSLSVPLGTRAGLSLATNVSYQPYSFASLFPTSVDSQGFTTTAPNLDTAIDIESHASYEASLGLSYRLSQRTSLSGGANYRAASLGADASTGFRQQGGSASLTHNIGRGVNLRLGYAHFVSRYQSGREFTRQSIDAGVDYGRALSISRRTSLSFSTGTTMTAADGDRQFRLTGGATLNHEIGRSWNAWVSYGRNVSIDENWLEPVMSDGLTVGLGGLLTRRVQFSVLANGALGTVGTDSNAPGFDTVNSQATLSVALARFVNLGVTYSYYHHSFDEGTVLPSFARPQMDRQSIRASVSLWAPLVTVARRTNASR